MLDRKVKRIFFLFFNIFIDYAVRVVPFPPLHSTAGWKGFEERVGNEYLSSWGLCLSSSSLYSSELEEVNLDFRSSYVIVPCVRIVNLRTKVSSLWKNPCDLSLPWLLYTRRYANFRKFYLWCSPLFAYVCIFNAKNCLLFIFLSLWISAVPTLIPHHK